MEHIGYIMDGNRRYAQKQKITLKEAYYKAVKTFFEILEIHLKEKIPHATFYALSTQNYKNRDKNQLLETISFIEEFFNNEDVEEALIENKIKVILHGNFEKLSKTKGTSTKIPKKELLNKIKKFESIENPSLTVHVAINYGGREEIIEAVKLLLKENPKNITEKDFERHLQFYGVPEPEMIIRTGKCQRLSNFLTWQSIYSELYFCPKLWPEFGKADLIEALMWFKEQKRNFGK
ncbi:MAG: polyprenyl diphosphate synthase [Nanoarchaeota archaeon]